MASIPKLYSHPKPKEVQLPYERVIRSVSNQVEHDSTSNAAVAYGGFTYSILILHCKCPCSKMATKFDRCPLIK